MKYYIYNGTVSPENLLVDGLESYFSFYAGDDLYLHNANDPSTDVHYVVTSVVHRIKPNNPPDFPVYEYFDVVVSAAP